MPTNLWKAASPPQPHESDSNSCVGPPPFACTENLRRDVAAFNKFSDGWPVRARSWVPGSAEGRRIDGDPDLPGSGEDPAVGVVQGGGGDGLAAVLAEQAAHHHAGLARRRSRVDNHGELPENRRASFEVGRPATR